MTITIASIVSAIKRHLATIGKRLYSKDGKNLFSDITLSSAEVELLNQYITSSAQNIEAVLKKFITSTVLNGSTIEITITNTRGDADFGSRVQALSESYITLNSLGEYLSMAHPDLAQKYQRDAQQRMEALMVYVIYKKPPTAPSHHYPQSFTTEEDSVDIGIGEEHKIVYSVPDGCIDDIEILAEDNTIVDAGRTEKGLTVIGRSLGHSAVTLFSRHNKSVSTTIQVYVTDQS